MALDFFWGLWSLRIRGKLWTPLQKNYHMHICKILCTISEGSWAPALGSGSCSSLYQTTWSAWRIRTAKLQQCPWCKCTCTRTRGVYEQTKVLSRGLSACSFTDAVGNWILPLFGCCSCLFCFVCTAWDMTSERVMGENGTGQKPHLLSKQVIIQEYQELIST